MGPVDLAAFAFNLLLVIASLVSDIAPEAPKPPADLCSPVESAVADSPEEWCQKHGGPVMSAP